MTELDLEAIRRRVPHVWSAPWTVEQGDPGDDNWYVRYATDNPLAGLVATVPDYGGNLAEFIATARTDVPALIAEVERLRALVSIRRHGARHPDVSVTDNGARDVGRQYPLDIDRTFNR